jgi:hypothetical protein
MCFLVAAYFSYWMYLERGKIITTAEYPSANGMAPKIVLRELSTSNAFLSVPLQWLGGEYIYRCEYYPFHASRAYSSQTFEDRGYRITGTSIKFTDNGDAIVSAGGTEQAKCDRNGNWATVQKKPR